MKRLYILLLLVLTAATSRAQMSEDQIIKYVKQQTEAGRSQTQIARDLVGRGVSIEQIKRLKSKYEKYGQGGGTQPQGTADDFDRLRKSNGERRTPQSQAKSPTSVERGASSSILRSTVGGSDTDDDDLFSYILSKDFKPLERTDTIRIFGHDIFRSSDLSFEPDMNIATPASYVLGPGDEVILDIYGASQVSTSFKVAPDGSVTIPNEGPVNIAGLTQAQAQAKVRRAIGAHYQDSQIKLSVGQTRTILVSVMGEVEKPGTYRLSAFATVFNALYLAGGVNGLGTLREVKVSRAGRVIASVDIYDYILNGRLAGNVMLREGDVIIVGPYVNLVKIEGRVRRPMYYEMKRGEKLSSLLRYAGGFTGDAYKEKVRVERRSDDGLTVHNIDEWDFAAFAAEDGDICVVSPVIERYRNTVKVTGAVFRPAQYKLTGAQSVKALIEQAGGLTEQAIASRGVIHRMRPDRTLQSLSVNIAAILDGTQPDVVLQNEDELIIASREESDKERTLSIYGEVYKQGSYPYSDGETVEDLITEAGGLRESASLLGVEVARRILSASDNPTGKSMAKIYHLTLKDGLAIEGETGFRLRPYDIVTIHRSPDYKEQRIVNVSGEVRYGGAYIIESKEERLTDILKRAGGMTPNAYEGGVQVIRRVSEKELEIQRLKLEVAKNAADSLEITNALTKTSYNVGINLRKALDNPGSDADIVMQEGDSIYVPQLNNVVKISGEVMFPNTVAYEQGRSATYYLNQAGGVSRDGKRSLAYIVYPNGQVSRMGKGKILPGCELVVPTKPERKADAGRATMWMTLASSIATIAAVLITALK